MSVSEISLKDIFSVGSVDSVILHMRRTSYIGGELSDRAKNRPQATLWLSGILWLYFFYLNLDWE